VQARRQKAESFRQPIYRGKRQKKKGRGSCGHVSPPPILCQEGEREKETSFFSREGGGEERRSPCIVGTVTYRKRGKRGGGEKEVKGAAAA